MTRISYNEKLQWSLTNQRIPLKKECTDKLKVKQFINEKLGKGFVPKDFVVANNVKDLFNKVEKYDNHPQTCLI